MNLTMTALNPFLVGTRPARKIETTLTPAPEPVQTQAQTPASSGVPYKKKQSSLPFIKQFCKEAGVSINSAPMLVTQMCKKRIWVTPNPEAEGGFQMAPKHGGRLAYSVGVGGQVEVYIPSRMRVNLDSLPSDCHKFVFIAELLNMDFNPCFLTEDEFLTLLESTEEIILNYGNVVKPGDVFVIKGRALALTEGNSIRLFRIPDSDQWVSDLEELFSDYDTLENGLSQK